MWDGEYPVGRRGRRGRVRVHGRDPGVEVLLLEVLHVSRSHPGRGQVRLRLHVVSSIAVEPLHVLQVLLLSVLVVGGRRSLRRFRRGSVDSKKPKQTSNCDGRDLNAGLARAIRLP